jgi:hypothetical protein
VDRDGVRADDDELSALGEQQLAERAEVARQIRPLVV